MKKLSKILSVLLCLAMIVGLVAVMVGAEESSTYTLVTDASTLAAGDKIIIAAAEYNYAISTTQNSNNRKAVAITKSGNEVTPNDGVQVLTVEAGTVEGTFAFNTGSGYLYAASASKNYLRTESSKSANSSWKITIANGVATVVAQGTNTRNTMQYNPNTGNGDPLFACYASASQKAIAIYKLNASSSDETTEGTTEGVTTETTVTAVETPETGVAYKMGMYQAQKGETLYFTGAMSGYYYATSNDVANGVDVYLEEADGGYYVYFTDANGQQYLYLQQSGKYNNVKFGETKQVFTFGDHNNLETDLNGTALYLGSYGSNTTIGASAMSYITGTNASKVDDSQYVVRLYTVTTTEGGNDGDPTEGTEDTENTENTENTEDQTPTVVTVPDGTYVIVNNDGTKALSSVYAEGSYYNSAIDVTVADGKVTGYTNAELWTVNTVDGITTITLYGTENKLGLGVKFNSMKVGGEDCVNTSWVLYDAGEGQVYIQNTREAADKLYNTIEYSSYGNWDVTGDTYKKGLSLIAAEPIVEDDGEDETTGSTDETTGATDETTGATDETTGATEGSSEETTGTTEGNVSGDTGDQTPGDTLSVFIGLLAVSTVGLAVVTSKKKTF